MPVSYLRFYNLPINADMTIITKVIPAGIPVASAITELFFCFIQEIENHRANQIRGNDVNHQGRQVTGFKQIDNRMSVFVQEKKSQATNYN